MIGIIVGQKGSGKTKRILGLANRAASEAKGSIVFIDDDNSYMYDLNRSIRFINATEYEIASPKMLYGFLCGIAAQDFDLEYIFVDAFMHFAKHNVSTLAILFEKLKAFSDAHNINLILSVSGRPEDLPASVREMVI